MHFFSAPVWGVFADCRLHSSIVGDFRRKSPIVADFRYEVNKEMVANVVSPYMFAVALDAFTRRGPSRKIA